MFFALALLILTAVLTPALLFFDALLGQAVAAVATAAGLAIVAGTLPPGEAAHVRPLVGRFAVLAALPAIWIVLQMVPLGLTHPVWMSAATALGHRVVGSISTDPGASALSLFQYLVTVGVAFLTTTVTVDRQRAEWLLSVLTMLTTAGALLLLLEHGSGWLAVASFSSQATIIAALGVPLSLAAIVRAIERRETRHLAPSNASFLASFVGPLIGCGLCVLALALNASIAVIVAVSLSIALIAIIEAIRRLGLGIWGISAIAVMLVVISIGTLAALFPEKKTLHIEWTSGDDRSTVERILADTPWAGTGAGTYDEIYKVYRESDVTETPRPTAAVQIAVELGKPALTVCSLGGLTLAFWLLAGALRRGRDSFYPMAGAACVLLILILSFVAAGPLGSASSILEGCIVGLGLAQSRSRIAT